MTKRISTKNARMLRGLITDSMFLEALWQIKETEGTRRDFSNYWIATATMRPVDSEHGKRTILWAKIRNRAIEKRGK